MKDEEIENIKVSCPTCSLPHSLSSNDIKRIRQSEQDRFREIIKKQKIRFEILLGRDRACQETNPEEHQVDMIEIPGWIEELDAIINHKLIKEMEKMG